MYILVDNQAHFIIDKQNHQNRYSLRTYNAVATDNGYKIVIT